jgi:aldose 1-epimerase
MSVTQDRFGTMPDGEEVLRYTITNNSGASASLLTYGATWQSMLVPDRSGAMRDVVLGYDTLEGYRTNTYYLGAIVGRVANRIGGARFTLNDREYSLFVNHNKACLHGGRIGFDKKNWRATTDDGSVVFSLLSPDGDENFPGNLSVMVTYTLSEDNALAIRYFASTDADTIVNLTNHAYFNLAGQGCGTVLGQTLTIDAERFTHINEEILPTGEIGSVKDGPLDFTAEKPIGLDIDSSLETMDAARGYDHDFILRHQNGGLEFAARAADPEGGIVMETYTDQPGLQFFTPFDFTGMTGKNGKTYGFRPAFCLETQHFADAMAHPDFPSIVLHAGEIFASETVYRFRTLR